MITNNIVGAGTKSGTDNPHNHPYTYRAGTCSRQQSVKIYYHILYRNGRNFQWLKFQISPECLISGGFSFWPVHYVMNCV